MEEQDKEQDKLYPVPEAELERFSVREAAQSPVRQRSLAFALAIVGLYKHLSEHRELVISKQLLRSGTSVGANVEEAQAAQSRRDFVSKMAIASKEARETRYWLRLISESDLASGVSVAHELEMVRELIALLTAIVKTAQASKST